MGSRAEQLRRSLSSGLAGSVNDLQPDQAPASQPFQRVLDWDGLIAQFSEGEVPP